MPVSTGIKLIAGLVGLLGLSQVVFGFMTITSGGTVSRYGAGRAGGALVLIGLLTLAVGVAALVVAYGLWTVRPWGWNAAAVLLAIGAAISVLLALNAGSVGALVMALAWNLGPLWYLWSVKGRYRSLSRRRHGHPTGVR